MQIEFSGSWIKNKGETHIAAGKIKDVSFHTSLKAWLISICKDTRIILTLKILKAS